MDAALILAVIMVGLFAAYNLFHYMLFFLVTHPRDAGDIGDENRTYNAVFGQYRGENNNYSTCVFPRAAFTRPYDAECVLLKPADGMCLLDLGCGSGAAADYLASRCSVEILCVTNSRAQADICQRIRGSRTRYRCRLR